MQQLKLRPRQTLRAPSARQAASTWCARILYASSVAPKGAPMGAHHHRKPPKVAAVRGDDVTP